MIMPFSIYTGLAASFIEGSFMEKIIAPRIHTAPLIITVLGAPMDSARIPARRLPIGVNPINAMV